ncbi:hypothetical protein PtA15_8A92 [Puccinia triticina]|uniref:Secreted protein n=1 Tax=Puccinia triticina TaxID=208348 RepID=A0ABY7CST8_9BASI|nr:uncharacterized protein PtA15_8A92 [Puccinia triticina]WAQ87191.1 hypothetical protein PtA15_8A92 [Puccinia triticina]WAR57038.1 hypothetical protein PtB15_8B82 [Puccinia triticina]
MICASAFVLRLVIFLLSPPPTDLFVRAEQRRDRTAKIPAPLPQASHCHSDPPLSSNDCSMMANVVDRPGWTLHPHFSD